MEQTTSGAGSGETARAPDSVVARAKAAWTHRGTGGRLLPLVPDAVGLAFADDGLDVRVDVLSDGDLVRMAAEVHSERAWTVRIEREYDVDRTIGEAVSDALVTRHGVVRLLLEPEDDAEDRRHTDWFVV